MPDEDKSTEALPQAEGSLPDEIRDAEVVEETRAAPSPVPPVRPEPRRSGSFLGTVLGGIIAAGAGFGVAQFVPQVWPNAAGDVQAEIAGLREELATIKTSVEAVAARPAPDLSADLGKLRDDVEARLAALPSADPGPALTELRATVDQALASFDQRLAAVEKAPTGSGGASATAIAAYERDLQALREQIAQVAGSGGAASAEIAQVVAAAKAELAAAAQEAEQLKADGAAIARQAKIDAALGRLTAAVEVGGPYQSAVTDLSDAGITVPAGLSDHAATGVASLDDLQRLFPAAARNALDAALRSDVGEAWTDRFTTFLRTQTGARSLQPREGNDPDAVLSRAEAAVAAGDLPGALTEIAALPDPAKAAMAEWTAAADARQNASAALAEVVQSVDSQ